MTNGTLSQRRSTSPERTQTLLNAVRNKLPAESSGKSDMDFVPYLGSILNSMIGDPKSFDQYCTVNIQLVGSSFTNRLLAQESTPNSLIELFAIAYRFVVELDFTAPGSLSSELAAVMTYVTENLTNFDGQVRRMLTYTHYVMPVTIARQLLHHPKVSHARLLFESLEKAEKYKQDWDKEIGERKTELVAIGSQLKHLNTGYNFVGLVDGFKRLAGEKVVEKHVAFASLIFLALLVVAPVSAELWFVIFRSDEVAKHERTLLYSLPALITLEVVLIYFFRVVLSHFRSIKAQLLQLDLRIALCQFIQSYAEYAQKIKAQSSTSLEKFESVIFSGLMASEETLPSTFDGTEQLTKLFDAIRGKP